MSEPAEPNWNLLPHDPVGFFGLDSDFDRKSLKRAYNRLLRIYKPEKHPEEFQKLRAAFEQLDNNLRYGLKQTEISVPDPTRWTTTVSTADSAQPGETTAQPSFADRLLSECPDTVFRELAQRESRSPYETFVMALLADTLPEKKPLRFLKCILSGLKDHQDDPGLMSLLYRYLRDSPPIEQVPAILKAVSKVVRTDRYYALTEPLWETLLRRISFSKFSALLTECERSLRAFRVESRLTFYVHLLRPALFRAPKRWVDEAFGFIDQNARELPPWLEFELEILSMLRDYVSQRETYRARHPMFHRIDDVFKAYCVSPTVEFDQAYIACQVHIASSPQDWMAAVDFPQTLELDAMMFLWECFRMEVSERNGVADAEPREEIDHGEGLTDRNYRRHARKARALMRVIDARSNGSLHGRIWNMLGWCYGLLAIGGIYVLIIAVSLTVTLSMGLNGGLSAIIAIGLAVLGYPAVKGLQSLWASYCINSAIKMHNAIWRAEIFDFVGRTRMSRADLVGILNLLPEDQNSYILFVINFVLRDDAIDVYAISQEFLS